MAISAATLRGRLRSSAAGGVGTSYTTGSATAMGANHLAIAFIGFSCDSATGVNSISGYGITWEDVASVFSDASFQFKTGANGQHCHIYAALTGAGTASGTLTVEPDAGTIGCNITVVEFTGDFSGATSALDAILQLGRDPVADTPEAVTGQTPSLSSAPDSDSRCVAYWGANRTGDVTFDADWTELDNGSHSTPSHLMGVAWRSDAADQTTAGVWTNGGTVFSVGYILELAEVPATTTTLSGFNVGMIE